MPRHLVTGILLSFCCAACSGPRESVPITPQPLPPSVNWAQAQTLDVILSDFDYDPATIELAQGRPYRIRFINQGSGGHDFTAPAFFAAAAVFPDDQAGVTDGRIDLKKGQRQDIRLVPITPGSYDVYCSHFLHKTFGMTGDVVVRAEETQNHD